MRRNYHHTIQLAFIIIFLFTAFSVHAQKKRGRSAHQNDTLLVMREFLTISKQYQQLPLYLEVQLNSSTNFITGEADTASTNAVFYLAKDISYARFGDAEQLVNDSMALLVNDKMQRMILYSNAKPVLLGLRSFATSQYRDSSLLPMANKFTAQYLPGQNDIQAILLNSRDLLPETGLPRESIELQYNALTKEPVRVITTKRTFFPVSEDDYKQLANRSDMAGKLLVKDATRFYVVKEQQGSFEYKKISHNTGMQLPAVIADRVTRNEDGEFAPVKQYQHYAVTIN
jgi:hypothetical protein